MKKKDLRKFLLTSNKVGYASGDEAKQIEEEDGSTTIVFEQGGWKSHDNYFGGEPYGGRIVVFYKDNPIWIMVYYGWVKKNAEADLVYEFLRESLLQMPEDYPFRGPQKYEKGKFVYLNTWQGEVDRLSGEEEIRQDKEVVYKASYLGGFIDRR
ncbi:MAG: DUF5680 domain-containing protein [Patescibacteria group bacterium]